MKKKEEKWVELGEDKDQKKRRISCSGVFFHTISDSPCTTTPLYNSTGRLNILRMLSSLFVSKHEPSGDLKTIQKKDKELNNNNEILYTSLHVLSTLQLKLKALGAKINLFSRSSTFTGCYWDFFVYKVTLLEGAM